MYQFNRDKDVQYWLEQSNFNKFSRKSAHDMILWLEVNEKLDSISFKYLEPIVRKEIHISNRDLYVFKVQVKPEYLKYAK
jgi:ribosomal protein L25 (general stress protein Ctc)